MRLFLSNIDYDAIERDLWQLFHERGHHPKNLKVIRDPEGNSRGYGFAEFASEADAEAALRDLDGWTLLTRRLNVQIAHPKPARVGGVRAGASS